MRNKDLKTPALVYILKSIKTKLHHDTTRGGTPKIIHKQPVKEKGSPNHVPSVRKKKRKQNHVFRKNHPFSSISSAELNHYFFTL